MAQSRVVFDDIQVEFARPSDAQALALMARDLIETDLGWTYRDERIGSFIADAESVALVARENDGTIGGFAIMKFGAERAHLVLLAVRPKHRRRGIARRLLTWLVESALIAGVMSIHVELRAGNRPAHRLYRVLGFVETFQIPRYYQGRETAVRMIRMLRAPNVVAEPWRPPTLDRQ